MSHCQDKKEYFHDLEAKHIKVKNFCAKDVKIKNLKTENIKAKNIEAEKILINGADVECLLGRPGVNVQGNRYDCMLDGVPQKPENIDQDVWDVLTCNRNAWQEQLQLANLEGRENIRCIKIAYGCEGECPPDCPVPPDCPLQECPSFPDNCDLLPIQCRDLDWKNCNLEIENKLYKTLTLPFVRVIEKPCGGVNKEGFPYAESRFVTSMNFNLDINNVTCNLASRVASILVHFAYKETSGPTGPTGPIDSGCTGETGATGLSCFLGDTGVTGCSDLSTEITCGIIRVNCRQFYFTINLDLGENFSGFVDIPSEIVNAMISATPLPFDPNNIIGAFQLAIFIEDGLEVSNNQGIRAGGGGGDGTPLTRETGCFNGEAKISMSNGEIKMAKDVNVGDELASSNGNTTKVLARYVQGEGCKELVKIRDLFISRPHRIFHEGKWIKPEFHPEAKLVKSEIPVYNFITENSSEFIVENIIASSVGQFCPGSHDISKPMHQLWASEKIIEIFKTHKQWPNIELTNDDPFLKMIKNINFVNNYLGITDNLKIKSKISVY